MLRYLRDVTEHVIGLVLLELVLVSLVFLEKWSKDKLGSETPTNGYFKQVLWICEEDTGTFTSSNSTVNCVYRSFEIKMYLVKSEDLPLPVVCNFHLGNKTECKRQVTVSIGNKLGLIVDYFIRKKCTDFLSIIAISTSEMTSALIDFHSLLR
ncbi:hypothetical protein NPIL_346711 [Nephila pilipes]|uniref:Uncharacterized protein n=1 Tax=Nephila pilipes TaxID=299642 RepID=A0A8X6T977_NEPPI|nr:hypothetical protein NPIL_346711 [Nephila pilipes]